MNIHKIQLATTNVSDLCECRLLLDNIYRDCGNSDARKNISAAKSSLDDAIRKLAKDICTTAHDADDTN